MKKSQSKSVEDRSNSKARSERKSSALRQKAEGLFSERNTPVLPQDALKAAHELGIHQIELEMQNEELRQTQDELIASREKYADLYDFAPVAYFTLDHMGFISEVNLTGASLLGVNRGQLRGKSFSLFVAAPSRDTFHLHHRGVLRTGTAGSCELRLTRKDGTSFYALAESAPAWDPEGNFTGVRSVVADITEHKKAQETRALLAAVREEKERLSALVNSIQDQVWFVDTQKRFILANPSAFPELGPEYGNGMDMEELAERLEVYRPDGSPCPIDETPPLRALQGEVVRNQEEMLRSPRTTKTTFIQVSSAPVRDQGGVIVGSVSVVRDITERKRVEEALKERLGFETLLADLSARFFNTAPEQVDTEIGEALRVICQHLDLDIGVLWQWSTGEPRFFTITHLHRPLGGLPVPEMIDGEDTFPWCLRELEAGRTVAVSTEEAPAEAARDQEVWRHYGIKSSLTVPLSLGKGPFIGALGFNTVREKRSWPEDLVKRLQLVAEIFANALTQKLSQEALCKSEERLSLATSAVGVGLWSLDLATGEFWTTPRTLELFQLPHNYPLNLKNFLNLVHFEDRERVVQAVNQASNWNEDERIEYRVILADNSLRWIASRGRRHLEPFGKAERLMGVSFDITERKLHEAQLEEQLRLEQLLSYASASLASAPLDRVDYEIEETLRTAREVLRADRCGLLMSFPDKGMWQITHAASAEGLPALPFYTDLPVSLLPHVYRLLVREKKVCAFGTLDELPAEADIDKHLLRGWGVRSAIIIPLGAGGSSDQFVVVTMDRGERVWPEGYIPRLQLLGEILVTAKERKLAAKELLAREAMLRSVISTSPVGISFSTGDRIIRWANEAMSYILSYSPEELIGRSARILYSTDEEFLRVGEMLYTHHVVGSALQTKWVRKDGRIRDVEVRAAYVDANDVSTGMVLVAQDITERLQAEAAAVETQSMIMAVLESTNDMIWSVDPERFGLLTFNSALKENLKGTGLAITKDMSPDDMIGGGFTPAVAAKWRAFYERALREGPYSEVYGANTSSLIFLLSFSLLKRDDEIFGISVFGKDITELKRKEEALRESEEKYRAVVEHAGDGVIIVQDGTVVYANPRMAELGGSTVELLVGSRIKDHINSTEVERVTELYKRLMAGETVPRSYETLLKRRDGSPADAELNVVIITYQGRHAALVTIRDISERKRMEESIRTAVEEWQSTFDAVGDLIMMLDRECRIIRINRAALSFFSQPADRILGNYCYTAIHGTEGCVEGCPVDAMRKSKRREEAELYDEERKAWFQVSADPIFDERGEVNRIIYRLRDITDRKKADLETFGARREMLRLERLLLMGELSASLAHELNQPLTSILSNARAAARFLEADRLTNEELKMILEDIVRDDKRAGDIIRSLRSMLKTEEGEAEITEMHTVLNEAVALFSSEAVFRNIAVKTQIPASLPLTKVNRVQIQQVVVNLMMNAAEAMENAPIPKKRMTVRATAVNGNLLVSVHDLGEGVDEPDMARLFEPFFTTKASGLGMGLSLSRSIVEAHGGHIWAENHKEGGAVFYFDLPCKG